MARMTHIFIYSEFQLIATDYSVNIKHIITRYNLQLVQNNNRNEFYSDDEYYAKPAHLMNEMNEIEGVCILMCEW